MQFAITSVLTTALLTSCTGAPTAPPISGGGQAGAGSGLSSIDIALPAGGGTLFSGVEFSIVRHGSSVNDDKCSPDLRAKVQAVTATGTQQLSNTVQNGCDYLITVKLGKLAASGNALSEVIYSSDVNGTQDDLVSRDRLIGGKVDVSIYVFKVGSSTAGGPDSLAASTNLIIDVSIGNSNASVPATINAGTTTSNPPAATGTVMPPTDTATPPTSISPQPTATPATGPSVAFTIPAGTAHRAWNSEAAAVVARVGQELKITNADSVTHKIYGMDQTFCEPLINGRSGSDIPAGATASCRLTAPYAGTPGLADFYYPTTGKFFLRVVP